MTQYAFCDRNEQDLPVGAQPACWHQGDSFPFDAIHVYERVDAQRHLSAHIRERGLQRLAIEGGLGARRRRGSPLSGSPAPFSV